MTDFAAAVGRAFDKGSPTNQGPSISLPDKGPPGFDDINDFHGKPEPEKRGGRSKKGGEKRKREGRSDRDGAPREKRERTTLPLPADPKEAEGRKEAYASILRYLDSFPEHINNAEMVGLSEHSPLDQLTWTLQRIQQRVNAKQELQVLQSGLVTTCMAVEFGSKLVPRNPVKLNGFGSHVSRNIAMFDDCLKQLACKYGGQISVSVESQLALIVVRCAVNTHMENALKEKFCEVKEESVVDLEENGGGGHTDGEPVPEVGAGPVAGGAGAEVRGGAGEGGPSGGGGEDVNP